METPGIVKKRDSDTFEIEVKRAAGCSSCGLCRLDTKKTVTVRLQDPRSQAACNDEVVLRCSDKSILSASFLVYGMPILFFFIGVALGQGNFSGREDLIAITAILGLLFGFLLTKTAEFFCKRKGFFAIEVKKHVQDQDI